MDNNPAIIALAAALEVELASLRQQLEALRAETDPTRLEEGVNNLIEELPTVLIAAVGLTHAKKIWESLLATAYAHGVAHVTGMELTPGLMRADKAFEILAREGALAYAANPLNETRTALALRAEALSKVVKGQLVQNVRDELVKLDETDLPAAQDALQRIGEKLGQLDTDSHVKAHVEAQQDMAKGYGVFTAVQRDAYLRAVPFQEFYRAEHRVEWRNWPERWTEQGGRFFAGPSDYPEGRMIAEVNSKMWEDLASYPDGTGSPYPPFAWNSGMSVKPMRVDEAKKLGLLGADHVPAKAKKLNFNASIQFSAAFDDDIKSALLDSMQDWAEQTEGEIATK